MSGFCCQIINLVVSTHYLWTEGLYVKGNIVIDVAGIARTVFYKSERFEYLFIRLSCIEFFSLSYSFSILICACC